MVVLFKMVLIQHLYGLPSLRKTADEVGLNVACRWFLGYTLQEETPHFSKEKTHTVTKNITDPDCGLFVKGNHKRQFAYEAHTACDKHGFVLETVVTPGNVHDSVAFDELYDKVTKAFPEAEAIVADSAYKTPHICKKVFDDGRVLLIIL